MTKVTSLVMCSIRYLTSERGERVSYKVEQEKRNSISTGNVYDSVYYINILITKFLTIFRRFPKILQRLSQCHTNVSEHFSKILQECRSCAAHCYIKHHCITFFRVTPLANSCLLPLNQSMNHLF